MVNLLWVVIGGVVLALAVGAYLVLLMRWRRGPTEGAFLHFRCPGCKRRIRFRARQSGHTGQCSHCGAKLTFPPAAKACD
jgi:hypothetical protein